MPPPPEKQQLGRFQEEFVEARRSALERMLNKIGQHALLQRDVDFKLFIESDAFNVDVKQREKANITESKGFMGTIGLGSGTFGGKMPESDEVSILMNVGANIYSGLKIERRILMPLKPNSKRGQRRLILSSNNEKVHLSKAMFNLQISPTQRVTLETPSSPSQRSNSMPHSAPPFPPSQTSKPKSKSYTTVKPNKTSSPSAASSKNTSAQSDP